MARSWHEKPRRLRAQEFSERFAKLLWGLSEEVPGPPGKAHVVSLPGGWRFRGWRRLPGCLCCAKDPSPVDATARPCPASWAIPTPHPSRCDVSPRDPGKASTVFARLLKRKRGFSWVTDGEELLRSSKPGYFDGTRLPRTVPLSGLLSDALQRTR
jgi:hypothetical protein